MNKIIKNTLILTAITLVSGLLLGFVHELTAAPIAEQEALAKAKAYAEVFPEAESFNEVADVSEVAAYIAEQGYASQVINEVAEACDGSGNVIGHVINITTPEGYGGNIQMTVGIKNDMTMLGISFLSISETAGLGMKATEPIFYEQYQGKQAEKFYVSKDGGDGEPIDALSGATITSRAMTGAVNAALGYFQNAF